MGQQRPGTTSVNEYVTTLKQQPGRDIGIHGSIELARTLLRDRLVDELRLVVAPAVVGPGRRVFDGVESLQKWNLRSSDRGKNGTLFLDYSRTT